MAENNTEAIDFYLSEEVGFVLCNSIAMLFKRAIWKNSMYLENILHSLSSS